MNIDPNRTVGIVERTISSRQVDDAPAQVIRAARGYAVPPEELWEGLTNPERIPRWFLPITGDLRPGGRYQLEGNAGGEILDCDPPHRLRVTWEMHGQVSWVSVRLAGSEAETRLELEHTAHVPEEMWNEFGPGAAGVGWDQALLGLDQHLATGEGIDPAEAIRWLASEEGREFVRRSSEAWCAASIAAGTDPAAAAAAAARTTAFYTAAPESQAEAVEPGQP